MVSVAPAMSASFLLPRSAPCLVKGHLEHVLAFVGHAAPATIHFCHASADAAVTPTPSASVSGTGFYFLVDSKSFGEPWSLFLVV